MPQGYHAREAPCQAARQVERILRFDPFGLRHRLPAGLVRFAFARLSVLVRRRVAGAAAETCSIVPADFTVVEASNPDALDLVIVPSAVPAAAARISSPRLARPEDAADFAMEVSDA